MDRNLFRLALPRKNPAQKRREGRNISSEVSISHWFKGPPPRLLFYRRKRGNGSVARRGTEDGSGMPSKREGSSAGYGLPTESSRMPALQPGPAAPCHVGKEGVSRSSCRRGTQETGYEILCGSCEHRVPHSLGCVVSTSTDSHHDRPSSGMDFRRSVWFRLGPTSVAWT